MQDPNETNRRIANARCMTRKVIQFTLGLLLIAVVLISIASVMTAFAPLGIITHPPRWLVFIAHVAAIAASILGAYVSAYLATSRRRFGKAAAALFTFGLYYMLTVSAVAWAVPVFTTALPTTSTTFEATVTGSSNLARARMGCKNRASFGEGLTPAGHICMDGFSGQVPVGWTFRLEGDRTAWATRVTGFVRP
jgi:hypothetical protein